MTTISLDEKQFKILLKQTLVELFEERSDIFSAIVVEALEDVGLANAIREGRKNDFMSREEIQATIQKPSSFQVGTQRRCVPTKAEPEDKEWARLSLASAMRGMEDEPGLYTSDDLKVKYTG